MLFTSPWFRFKSTSVFKQMGFDNLQGDMKVLYGQYYFLRNDLDIIYDRVQISLEKKDSFFEDYFKICNQKTKALLELENKKDLRKFILEMIDFMGCSILVEMLDFCLQKYLKGLSGENKLSLADFYAKIDLPRQTELMGYQFRLPRIEKNNFKEFVQKYRWVGTHAFEGSPLTKNKVFSELELLGKNKTIKEPPKIKVSSKLESIIKIGSELAFQRSNLMETIDRVAFSYWPKLKTLRVKQGLSFREVVSMTEDELLEFIDQGRIPNNLKERGKKFGVIQINNIKRILLGNKLSQAINLHKSRISKVKTIKGVVAYRGKIKGTVKILEDIKDVSKVNQGDIIVAPETTPDYVLALRKAAAFVTNQGGITSHAAIVARELKVPCIISTQNATKVLKDGGQVLVDANKGIVTILKNK